MNAAEMVREITNAKNALRISILHQLLNSCDLSREEYLAMESLMTARLYDGSMSPRVDWDDA